MTQAQASRAAAALVQQLKKANASEKSAPKVSSAMYQALQRRLEKRLQAL